MSRPTSLHTRISNVPHGTPSGTRHPADALQTAQSVPQDSLPSAKDLPPGPLRTIAHTRRTEGFHVKPRSLKTPLLPPHAPEKYSTDERPLPPRAATRISNPQLYAVRKCAARAAEPPATETPRLSKGEVYRHLQRNFRKKPSEYLTGVSSPCFFRGGG
ncbi:hypothetical protein MRB53_037726 [Persea americana]|nr:hypothetical protein MRB53_037726 [Persea americana]